MPPTRVLAFTAALLCAATAVGVVGLPAAEAAPAALPLLDGPATPGNDDFYRPPGGLDDLEPGEVIRARESRAYYDPARLLPVPAKAWQVLYRSTTARDEANAVSGTVLVPTVPWRSDGPRPIVSYTVGTHGLGDRCAPSYKMAAGSEQELGLMSQALGRGWAVAVTDYEGLGTPGDHTYVVQLAEGRAALDMARAAIDLDEADLSEESPVGFWGYSQGGGAAAAAAEQSAEYAGELRVVGSALGGVPADLLAVARNLDGSPYFGLLGAATVGLNAGYPGLEIEDELLNDRGRELIDTLRDQCVEEFAVRYPGRRLAEFSTRDDPLSFEPLRERLRENRIGGVAPEAPVLVYHAQLDQLIPLSVGRELVDEYCERDVPTEFRVIPATEHIGGAAAGGSVAVDYLAGRFAGRPAPSGCG